MLPLDLHYSNSCICKIAI